MSAVDQAAPERIYAWQWPEVAVGQWSAKPSGGTVEYIRADLIQDADMAECAAFFAGYEAGEADGRAILARIDQRKDVGE